VTNVRGGRPVVDFDLDAATSRRASDDSWAQVRASGYPVAWTERQGGYWVVTGYDEVAAAFRDWERFSSARFDPDQCAISFSNGKVPLLLPEESDPPEWKDYRRTIAALLSPLASEHLRSRARVWADHYLDRVIETGACDLVDDFTVPVPASVVLEWMGFPRAEWEWFWSAFHGVSAHPNGTPEHRKATEAYADVMTRITEELRDRVRAPRDDALTTIALHEVNGERITEDVARSIAFLTVTGGIDTTTSFTGGALLHLTEHPADRARLLADPDLLPVATEEFLRYYPPARTHARTVAVDTEFAGVAMQRGQRVLLSEAAAGRDATVFPDAEDFVIDRDPNRHLAFGVGIHRCPGSHLARVEFSEMVAAVLRRMPDYAIDLAAVEEYPTWSMVGGWRRLPATFTPGSPVGDG